MFYFHNKNKETYKTSLNVILYFLTLVNNKLAQFLTLSYFFRVK